MTDQLEGWECLSLARAYLNALEGVGLESTLTMHGLRDAMGQVLDLFAGCDAGDVPVALALRIAQEKACEYLGVDLPPFEDLRHRLAWEAVVRHLHALVEGGLERKEAAELEVTWGPWAADKMGVKV